MAGESNKVDKHDREKEVKRGALDKDTFNDMKKATLKENMYIDDEEWEKEMDRTPEDTEKAIDKEASKMSEDAKKNLLGKVVGALRTKYPDITAGILKDFIKTHYQDLLDGADIEDEFAEYISVNYEGPSDFMNEEKELDDVYGDGDVVVNISGMSPGMKAVWEIEKEISEFGDSNDAQMVVDNMIEINSEEHLISYLEDRGIDTQTIVHMVKAYNSASVNEKKGKDHDGDGDIDGDDYMAAKDKAIKKAMGKEEQLKEAIKSIIKKTLNEDIINEAATNELARIADDYAGFEGMKSAILDLQNVVSDIEAYYDKTRDKIQKVYDRLGEIRNEEGLKVGGFLAPAIESAFLKDLRPVTKTGFTKGLETPKVRTLTQADIDAARERGEIDETPEEPIAIV